VASRNPFALLDEDGSNPPAPEPAPPTSTAAADQPPARGGNRARGGRGGPASRGGKYYARGGPRTSAPRDGAEEDGADDSANKKVEFSDGNIRSRGRGRGRGRGDRDGSRGDGGGFRSGGGRREFDRRSATGKTDSEKKIHQSWGGDEGQTELATETAAADDAAAEQAAPAENWEPTGGGGDEWGAAAGNTDWGTGGGNTEWGAEGGNADWAAPPPASTTNAEEPAERSDRRPKDRQEEEPDNTLTLDEYLAQQKKSSIIPQLEARKVERDDGLWKGATALVKGAEEDAYFVGKTKAAPKARTKKEEKVFLEIEARFERPNTRGGRGRGDRADRGGERGGRGTRGPRRGSRPNGDTSAVNVDDETAFPSLS